jgi:hypothetical protein
MPSNIKVATPTRGNMLDEIVSDIGSNGLLRIYSGSQPASPTTAITTQTLLAQLALSATAGTVSNGVLTFSTITSDTSADASGTAAWYRITTSGGTGVIDGTVGTATSDLILNTTTIVDGGTVSVSSFTYTAPGG